MLLFPRLKPEETYMHSHEIRYGASNKLSGIMMNENLFSIEKNMNFVCKFPSQTAKMEGEKWGWG